MLKIKNIHKDKSGNIYNIKNYNCDEVSDINQVLGKSILSSHDISQFSYDENGIYLYHSQIDLDKAFRLYKNYNLHKYIYHSDAELISTLQERQSKINLTEFPTAIITVGDSVIGQEIVYYDKYETLKEQKEKLKDVKKLLLYYKQILNIVDELLLNGIYYKDLNFGNFVVKDDTIKLIDFEPGFISFDDDSSYYGVLCNLKNLLKFLNNNLIDFDFSKLNSIEDIKEEIMIKSKNL